MTGTNYPAITPTDIEQFIIAIPNGDNEMNSLTKKLDGLDTNFVLVKSKIVSSQSLQKSLINQIF